MLSHLGILGISAILAISINMFMLDTPMWKTLTANVLTANDTQSIQADFIAQSSQESISFHNSKDMSDVVEIAFSISYNPDDGSPINPSSLLANSNLNELQNEAGIASYIISFPAWQDILTDSEILKLNFKKQQDLNTHINVMNVNFKDSSGETFLLSSAGIVF